MDLTAEHMVLARRLVSSHIARRGSAHLRDEWESAAMEALITAARSFDPGRGVPFEAWATTKIKGALIDAHRSWFGRHGQKATAGSSDFLRVIAEVEPTTDPVEVTAIAREELALLEQLPDRERAALIAVAAGRPHAELAGEWGVSESRVSQVLSRGRLRFAELLAAA